MQRGLEPGQQDLMDAHHRSHRGYNLRHVSPSDTLSVGTCHGNRITFLPVHVHFLVRMFWWENFFVPHVRPKHTLGFPTLGHATNFSTADSTTKVDTRLFSSR